MQKKKKQNKNYFYSVTQLLGESYGSFILGLVMVIVGVLVVASVFKHKPNTQQVSSIATSIKVEKTQKKEIAPIIVKDTLIKENQNIYIVKAGDDLWSIAEHFYKSGYSWVAIAKANSLENPGVIYSGTKLIIPSVTPIIIPNQIIAQVKSVEVAKVDISSNAIKGDTYAVKKGDDLWDIAVRAYGDGYKWIDIAKVNNLTDPGLIHSDNILKIPRQK